jgi:hypothetical protein
MTPVRLLRPAPKSPTQTNWDGINRHYRSWKSRRQHLSPPRLSPSGGNTVENCENEPRGIPFREADRFDDRQDDHRLA